MQPSWSPPSPFPRAITTERTVIRPYRKGDGPGLHAALEASHELAWLLMTWGTGEHPDLDDCIYYVERKARQHTERNPQHLSFAIADRDDDTVLGGTGVVRIDAAESTAEIGYWIRGDRNGEGLCTEVVAALVTALLTDQASGGWGFRRVTLLCGGDNHGSRRVAEKLGLRLERRERAERRDPRGGDGYVDALGYAVLASEWDFEAARARPGIGWPD